jgi:hypothetical protein
LSNTTVSQTQRTPLVLTRFVLQDHDVPFVFDDIAAMSVEERREYAKLPQSSGYFVAHGVRSMFVTACPNQTEVVTKLLDAMETPAAVFVIDEADEAWGNDIQRPRGETFYKLARQRRHARDARASTLQSVFPGVHALVQFYRTKSNAVTWHSAMQVPYTSMALTTGQVAPASEANPSKKMRTA